MGNQLPLIKSRRGAGGLRSVLPSIHHAAVLQPPAPTGSALCPALWDRTRLVPGCWGGRRCLTENLFSKERGKLHLGTRVSSQGGEKSPARARHI